MAHHGFLSWAILSLCLLLTVAGPPQAHSSRPRFLSSRGFFGIFDQQDTPPQGGGICAESVIPYGYKCLEFKVMTQDGYIISMQRIPEGRSGASGKIQQPVLLQHGVLVDGTTWFLNSPEQDLPLILADNGFDVWIANTRGTRFSQKHVSLKPSQSAYWDWSWDELVKYDLSATVGFVYNRTSQPMHYVGHSLGTLIMLASLSEGRLIDMLKSAALLAPVAYLSHMTTALGRVAAKAFVGELFSTFAGVAEFDPKTREVTNLLNILCGLPGVDCYDLLKAITGQNCCLNAKTVNLFLANEPQPTSTKNMIHLAQTVRTGVLANYNYGRADHNLAHYGEASPPLYNLSNIPKDIPLLLSYGGKDALSDTVDVENLLDYLRLHDVDKLFVQFVKDYAHLDFIMGVNAKDIVYNGIIKFFNHH